MSKRAGTSPGESHQLQNQRDIRNFLRPAEVFNFRRRKAQSPRKHPSFSPLKFLDSNSPGKSRLLHSKSPFKLRKTPVKRSQLENFVAVSKDKVDELRSKSAGKQTAASTPKTKRQLNFCGAFSGEKRAPSTPQIVDLEEEETNLEAPVKKCKLAEPADAQGAKFGCLPVDWSLKTRVRYF